MNSYQASEFLWHIGGCWGKTRGRKEKCFWSFWLKIGARPSFSPATCSICTLMRQQLASDKKAKVVDDHWSYLYCEHRSRERAWDFRLVILWKLGEVVGNWMADFKIFFGENMHENHLIEGERKANHPPHPPSRFAPASFSSTCPFFQNNVYDFALREFVF